MNISNLSVPFIAITEIDKENNTINLILVKTPVQTLEEQSDYIKAKAELDYALYGPAKGTEQRASMLLEKRD